MLSNYSKVIGTVVGALVGVGASWLATKVPGLAQCVTAVDGTQACTILGEPTSVIGGMITMLFAAIGTHQAPPNKPA